MGSALLRHGAQNTTHPTWAVSDALARLVLLRQPSASASLPKNTARRRLPPTTTTPSSFPWTARGDIHGQRPRWLTQLSEHHGQRPSPTKLCHKTYPWWSPRAFLGKITGIGREHWHKIGWQKVNNFWRKSGNPKTRGNARKFLEQHLNCTLYHGHGPAPRLLPPSFLFLPGSTLLRWTMPYRHGPRQSIYHSSSSSMLLRGPGPAGSGRQSAPRIPTAANASAWGQIRVLCP